MPTYEYECTACGHGFEEFRNMTDKTRRKCPKCGKTKLRRLIGSGGAVIFKGSGFYQTDYRSSEYKSKAKAEAPKDACPCDSAACPVKSECPKAASGKGDD